jgi:uncharacterized protein
VRCQKKTARIEVEPDRIETIANMDIRQKISTAFARIGFEYTSIDIDGYKTAVL